MPQTFPLSPNHPSVIAPFWADIDLTFSGNLWARQGKLADIQGGTETGNFSQHVSKDSGNIDQGVQDLDFLVLIIIYLWFLLHIMAWH